MHFHAMNILNLCKSTHGYARTETNNIYYSMVGLGIMYLPNVSRVLGEYDLVAQHIPISSPVRLQLATMLLSASWFLRPSWKPQAINRAKALLEPNPDLYLHAWVASRECSHSSSLGDKKGYNEIYEKFVHSSVLRAQDYVLKSNTRYNAQRAELILSYAQNLIQDCKFALARKELSG